ncbi:hypothetical protein GCM10009827_026160 [Dactylosporangium maewongense]|uniref:Uncharacterized protein n=1 Tax=Dactylosporangium maewongense TaxID=634393 RepID=A0ABP4KV85_9ACTN
MSESMEMAGSPASPAPPGRVSRFHAVPFHQMCCRVPSVPRVTVWIQFAESMEMAGSPASPAPPGRVSRFQVVPFHQMCCRVLSVPRANTWIQFAESISATGRPARLIVGNNVSLVHAVPFHQTCCSVLSARRSKPCSWSPQRTRPEPGRGRDTAAVPPAKSARSAVEPLKTL